MFKKREFTAEQLLKIFLAIILFVFLVAIPWAINNAMMYHTIPTAENLNNSDWLSFWGGYIGSVFAIITTFLVFLATYVQNEKQHRATRELMREQARLQILPAVEVIVENKKSFSHTSIIKGLSLLDIFSYYESPFNDLVKGEQEEGIFPNIAFYDIFSFNNIGQSSLMELSIIYNEETVCLGNLQKGQQSSYYFLFPDELDGENLKFELNYKDLQNNTYKQSFGYTFEIVNSEITKICFIPTEYPELIL